MVLPRVMPRKFKISYLQWRYFSQRAQKNDIKASSRCSKWESVIGLEIHAQINSKSKLFSGAATSFAAPTNSQVAFMDAALPGTLPVLNQRCVEAGVFTALALNCRLNMVSRFDRKHYFYADLPAGYQITQQRQPLAVQGHLKYLCVDHNNPKQHKYCTAHITQLQLEQDSGKSLHDPEAEMSLIDLNRAGMGLMEIVTEPDFRSSLEAASFVRELQLILQALKTCDGKMSEGSLRVDASVSLRHPGEELGVRAEVKNINSIRNVAKAIDYEIERQTAILESGQEVRNETRAFDGETDTTIAMRDKEKVHDYRFLPEPNLVPLVLRSDTSPPPPGFAAGCYVNVDDVKRRMTQLPDETRQRLKEQYGISMMQSIILVNDPDLLTYFEEMVKCMDKQTITVAANLLHNELLGLLNKKDMDITSSPVSPAILGEIADLLAASTVSAKVAKKVLQMVMSEPRSPRAIVEENGWTLVTDTAIITEACDKVLREHSSSVESYLKGKEKVFNYLIGQLQKDTQGRAEPKLASQIMKKQLDNMKRKPK